MDICGIVEAKTYNCFCQLMKRMTSNFPHGGAMDNHFANMRSLIQVCCDKHDKKPVLKHLINKGFTD